MMCRNRLLLPQLQHQDSRMMLDHSDDEDQEIEMEYIHENDDDRAMVR